MATGDAEPHVVAVPADELRKMAAAAEPFVVIAENEAGEPKQKANIRIELERQCSICGLLLEDGDCLECG